jgi:type II secretory pathway pseudopilin PulG
MNMRNMRKPGEAFTLVELIVVIATVALLSALSLSAVTGSKSKAQRIACINNLKQVGLAFRAFAIDNDGNMPQSLATSQGGASEEVGMRDLQPQQRVVVGGSIVGSRGVSMMYLCMSNELSTPKILFCPAEYESSYRTAASSFANPGTINTNNAVLYTNDLQVSYFIGVDAQETSPRLFLTGDHNIGGDANPPITAFCAAPSYYSPSYAVWLGTNWLTDRGPAFMANQHDEAGNVGLADGSVEGFNRSRFQDALKRSGDVGRAMGSFKPATGIGPNPGPGCNRIQLP